MSAITKQTNTLVGINLVDIPETVSSRCTIGSPIFFNKIAGIRTSLQSNVLKHGF